MMQRQQFAFSDTGTEVQTSVPFFGEILQYRWVLQSGDTGGNLEISLHPALDEDTGLGWTIASHGLQPQLVKALRQPAQASDGLDTGVDFYVPVVAAGDRIRAVRTATAAGAIVGRLYLWSRAC
jgi:hypothetical protein